ncbi:MAG: hypothetical protein DIZ78_12330 [endosymbiont of Escarpia spicata]|uniref:HNH nuclease domain-containing protein n=1 Tax=endosymbiont of Escarpia spicata TaxID=2200908 RepID=A0A370DHK7_9GAMM|nr:MAG: hypothetical protein DIZ78_12330 [endosymbiont of Escarpia spicata]
MEILVTLKAVDDAMPGKSDAEKVDTAANGNDHWRPVKTHLEDASNRKCWYTESKSPGCQNDVEHFRPKARVPKEGCIEHWYWFLAFNPINYRLSSQFSNRLNYNSVLGATGGKGNKFPLMPGSPRVTDMAGLDDEQPVILDPCIEADTELLEFQPDGRPVVSMKHVADVDARYRVEQSKLLLNLDFPTFNEGRESLYNRIKELVERGDRYVRDGVDALEDVQNDLRALMHEGAEYSKAAECYIRCFRDRDWVEELIL